MWPFDVVREKIHVVWTAGDKLREIYLQATPKELVDADRRDTRNKAFVYALWCTAVIAAECHRRRTPNTV